MMVRELMRITGLMTWIIRFAFPRARFVTAGEVLRQKGGHQRDPQEAVNQGKASHQEAQESLGLPVQRK